jgi:hypothetical protein
MPPPGDYRSTWGLPRNFVFSLNRGQVPDQAEAWLKTRDDFEGLLLDLLDAYRAGLVGERSYDRQKARLNIARRTADQRYERAMRIYKKTR